MCIKPANMINLMKMTILDGAQPKLILMESMKKVIGEIVMKIAQKDAMLEIKNARWLNVHIHSVFHPLLDEEIISSMSVSNITQMCKTLQ